MNPNAARNAQHDDAAESAVAKLTLAQVAHYGEHGFLAPVDALSPERAAQYRAALEESEREHGPIALDKRMTRSHLLFDWAASLVREPAIVDRVAQLLGPDLLVFSSTVFPKASGDGSYVSWHQDSTYHGLEPPEQVSVWVALSNASIEAGCMEVIPGSQRLGQVEHVEQPSKGNLLSRGQTIAEPEAGATAFMPLRPGQVSMHDIFLIHRSGPNTSNDRRIGVSISYVPTRCRNLGPGRLTASLVRGIDRYGHFDPEPRPQTDYDAAARAAHADAIARYTQMRKALFD